MDEILTVQEAAQLLRISTRTVREKLHGGQMPGRKVGREWRIPKQRLLDWLANGPLPERKMTPDEFAAWVARVKAEREPLPEPPPMTPEERDAWGRRLDAVVARMRSCVPPDLTPEEIEADITAVSEEMRHERLARRR